MHPALYYTTETGKKVKCLLCPHECIIANNEVGICKVRKNSNGRLFAETYGRVTALAVDPIEKKPLYHFLPGQGVLSIGSIGCNMACSFCQNAHISQVTPGLSNSLMQYSAKEIIDQVIALKQAIIAYTYNEPIVFYEFMMDCASLAKSKGIYNVMVSNGFINEKPLEELIRVIDAFNIDLKAFDNGFYKKITHARLDPVLKSIQQIADSGKHMELTFLVIPDLNDDAVQFEKMIKWIADVCGEDQVLHLSRYFPHHNMHKSSTPLRTIEELTKIARRKLNFVYPGNTGLTFDANTYCPECNELLIERSVYEVKLHGLSEGKCNKCGVLIPGVLNF